MKSDEQGMQPNKALQPTANRDAVCPRLSLAVREGRHIVMSDGTRLLTIPRHDPVNVFTMGGIVRDAGPIMEDFRSLS